MNSQTNSLSPRSSHTMVRVKKTGTCMVFRKNLELARSRISLSGYATNQELNSKKLW
jgi:hypothetical protein